jgi:hypothetical protein
MHTRTTWQTADGRIHAATVIGDETDGYELRSDCGLVGNACWEKQIDDDAEVTCHRCRSTARAKQPVSQAEPPQM